MIYYTDPIQDFDLTQYKRHFTFGCCFTNYYWPSWADVIANAMPDAGYVNTAKPGAGNSYILAKLSQALRYYNIGEDDLVTIMWTSFYRQDRYREGEGWKNPGNIYTQDDIPMEVVVKHLDDTMGFAVRDYAIVDTATNMLKNHSCDSIMMWGVEPSRNDYYGLSQTPNEETDWSNLQVFYKDLDQIILPDLLGTGCGGHWAETFSFKDDQGNSRVDYHPKTETYYNYLKKIGFNLPEDTGSWEQECDRYTEAVELESQLQYLHKWFDLA